MYKGIHLPGKCISVSVEPGQDAENDAQDRERTCGNSACKTGPFGVRLQETVFNRFIDDQHCQKNQADFTGIAVGIIVDEPERQGQHAQHRQKRLPFSSAPEEEEKENKVGCEVSRVGDAVGGAEKTIAEGAGGKINIVFDDSRQAADNCGRKHCTDGDNKYLQHLAAVNAVQAESGKDQVNEKCIIKFEFHDQAADAGCGNEQELCDEAFCDTVILVFFPEARKQAGRADQHQRG